MLGDLTNSAEIRFGKRCRKNKARSDRGVTLIETMVAAVILIIVVVGLLPVFLLGLQSTEQQGDIATRTSEYAQDKMESLLKLAPVNFNDAATDTTVFPANSSGGSGLGGTMAADATVGGIPPSAPVAEYVDYLDTNGNLLTSSTGAYYTRQWQISTDATATLKTITVVVKSLQTGAVKGIAPSTKLVCIVSSGL